jgi:hypothetical protein
MRSWKSTDIVDQIGFYIKVCKGYYYLYGTGQRILKSAKTVKSDHGLSRLRSATEDIQFLIISACSMFEVQHLQSLVLPSISVARFDSSRGAGRSNSHREDLLQELPGHETLEIPHLEFRVYSSSPPLTSIDCQKDFLQMSRPSLS